MPNFGKFFNGGIIMKYNVITISREFGSGGRYIGEELSKKLGWEYYDKEIITKVAEKTGFAEEFVEQAGEHCKQGQRRNIAGGLCLLRSKKDHS